MIPDDVLTIVPARLQRESSFRDGYLAVERPACWLASCISIQPPCPVAPDWGRIGRGSILAASRTGEAI